jgi:hypothetical protein
MRGNMVPAAKSRGTAELVRGADFPSGVADAALLLQVERNLVQLVGVDGGGNQRGGIYYNSSSPPSPSSSAKASSGRGTPMPTTLRLDYTPEPARLHGQVHVH